jgi:hypothetical protein
MQIYQWAFYYFTNGTGYGTRRTKYGPLFSSLESAKEDLNEIRIRYSTSFFVGFIYSFMLDEMCYGIIIYKTDDSIPIEIEQFSENISR